MNGVGAGSGSCGQRCRPQAEDREGPRTGGCVAPEAVTDVGEMGTLADSTLACVMDYFENLWLKNMFVAFGVWVK